MYSFNQNQPAASKTQPLRNKGLLQARHIQHRLKASLKQETLVLPSNQDSESYFGSIWY